MSCEHAWKGGPDGTLDASSRRSELTVVVAMRFPAYLPLCATKKNNKSRRGVLANSVVVDDECAAQFCYCVDR